MTVAPDGKSLYVGSSRHDTVARFNRNTANGAITQPPGAAGCISETGAGRCANGHGLEFPIFGDGRPRREEPLRRLGLQQRRVRFNRNTATGAIGQPAGSPGA